MKKFFMLIGMLLMAPITLAAAPKTYQVVTGSAVSVDQNTIVVEKGKESGSLPAMPPPK